MTFTADRMSRLAQAKGHTINVLLASDALEALDEGSRPAGGTACAQEGELSLGVAVRAEVGGWSSASEGSSRIFWKREAASTVDCIARLPPARSCSISMTSFPQPEMHYSR